MRGLARIFLSTACALAGLAPSVGTTAPAKGSTPPPQLSCRVKLESWQVKTTGKKAKVLLKSGDRSFLANAQEAKKLIVTDAKGNKVAEINSGELLKARPLDAARRRKIRVEVETDQVTWLKIGFHGPEKGSLREIRCDRVD